MNKTRLLFYWFFSCFSGLLLGEPAQSKSLPLNSPNGTLSLQIEVLQNQVYYFLLKGTDTIIQQSLLDVQWKNKPQSTPQISFGNIEDHRQSWNAIWGQNIQVENRFRSVYLELKWNDKTALHWYFRLYDNGLGFRYQLHLPREKDSITILNENSQMNVHNLGECWWAWADYDTQEQLFHHTNLSEATWVNTPFTIRLANGTHVAIHEAALTNYSRMTLKRNSHGIWTTDLAPWPNGELVRSVGTIQSPWRTILVEENAAGLLLSEVVRNLNEPCKIQNTQWIKPISYIGIWWEMHLGEKTWTEGSRHGATTQRAKEYIDFAAINRIDGVLVEGWNSGWDRWGKDSVFDQTTAASDYNLAEVAKYAQQKGVQLIAHCETGGDALFFESRLDSIFSMYQSLGIKYVKTGYAGAARPMGAHLFGQNMVEHFQKVVETAAQYKLMLDVHECVQPTGLERTWPNLMTGESVRGQEWEAWSVGNNPNHTVLLPFIRGLAGPMDYNPGIFDVDFSNRKSYVKWNGQETETVHPQVHSTPAHQMALMIALYSPMQMAADIIENYRQSPEWTWFLSVFQPDFIETKILYAEIGSALVVARKQKNGVWIVGAVNNEQSKTFQFSWESLGLDTDLEQNRYTIVDQKEGNGTLLLENISHKKSPTETVTLGSGGGKIWVIIPRPQRELFED